MNGADLPKIHNHPPPPKKAPKVSRRHLLTLERILGPCGAAREQPSVSCVCSKAGEGRPASSKESGDPGKWEKRGVGGGALWKGQGPERREKSSHKTVSLQRDRERESKGQIDREREEGVAGTMPLQLQVQWLRRCVCDCVRREHFLFCVN